MRNTISNGTDEKEKDMFSKWLAQEIEEWKGFGYHGYEEIPFGIEENGKKAVWQQNMYHYLFEKIEGARYLFTYCFFHFEEKTYCVDIGRGDFEFRIFFRVYEDKIETEVRLKRGGQGKYYGLERYLLLEGHSKEELKKHLPTLFSFYEEVKMFISTRSLERLMIVTKGIVFHEENVEKLKDA